MRVDYRNTNSKQRERILAGAKAGTRVSIEFDDLKEKIETYRSDNAWKELTFQGKVRCMIQDLIDLVQQKDPTVGKIICDHWEEVTQKVSIPSDRLKELRLGHRATDAELVQLATVLPYSTHELVAMQEGKDRCEEKKPELELKAKQSKAKQLQEKE